MPREEVRLVAQYEPVMIKSCAPVWPTSRSLFRLAVSSKPGHEALDVSLCVVVNSSCLHLVANFSVILSWKVFLFAAL